MALQGVPKEHRALISTKLLEEANLAQVVWARVKGYPYWPAQVLSDAAAQKKLGKVAHKKDLDVPVMFFGTLEIAWIGQVDVVSFKEGIQKGFLAKGKHKSFHKALTQVNEFLSLDKKRKAPQYWWCKAPSTTGSDEDDGAKVTKSKGGKSNSKSKTDESDSSSSEEEDDEHGSDEDEQNDSQASSDSDDEGTEVSGSSASSDAEDGEEEDKEAPAKPACKAGASDASGDEASQEQHTRPITSAAAKQRRATPDTGHERSKSMPARSQPTGKKAAGADSGSAPQSAGHPKPEPSSNGAGPSQSVPEEMQPPKKRLRGGEASATAVSALVTPPPNGTSAEASVATIVNINGYGHDQLDISKLPAEIRRLAGIKLVKKPVPAATTSQRGDERERDATTASGSDAGSQRGQHAVSDAKAEPQASDHAPPHADVMEGTHTSALAEGGAGAAAGRKDAHATATPDEPPGRGAGGRRVSAPAASRISNEANNSTQVVPGKAADDNADPLNTSPPGATPVSDEQPKVEGPNDKVKVEDSPVAPAEEATVSPTSPVAKLPDGRPMPRELLRLQLTAEAIKGLDQQHEVRVLRDRKEVTASPAGKASAGQASSSADQRAQSNSKERHGEKQQHVKDRNSDSKQQHAKDRSAEAKQSAQQQSKERMAEQKPQKPAGPQQGSKQQHKASQQASEDTARREPEQPAAPQPQSNKERTREQRSSRDEAGPSSGRDAKPSQMREQAAPPPLRKRDRDRSSHDNEKESSAKDKDSSAQSQPEARPESDMRPPKKRDTRSASASAAPVPPPPPRSRDRRSSQQPDSDRGGSGAAPSRRASGSVGAAKPSESSDAAAVDGPGSSEPQHPVLRSSRRSSPAAGSGSEHGDGEEAAVSGAGRGDKATAASAATAPAATAAPALPAAGPVESSPDEDMLDAEAAEALQLMGMAIARPVHALSEHAYDEATTSQHALSVPFQHHHGVSDFVWPMEEPLLPDVPEVFCPPKDWLMARPPRFEYIKRNIWMSKRRPARLHKDDISVCACQAMTLDASGNPVATKGCAEGCLNRLSFIHCDNRSCPCGELCCNKPFHLLKMPRMEAFLTENRGHGVRVQQYVKKGAFIIEYAGEVIDNKELERRMDAARQNGQPHYYIMELAPALFIDARRRGNLARLLNSSCEPNCETQKWHDAATGEARIGIFARRDIYPGEELTYDYFFAHYGPGASLAGSFKCMCGAKNCRGTMDPNPEKRKDLGRRVEVYWDGDGIFYRGTIIGYSSTSRKHIVLYDDGDKERVCLDEVPHKWLDPEPLLPLPHLSHAAAINTGMPGIGLPSASQAASHERASQPDLVNYGTGLSDMDMALPPKKRGRMGLLMGPPPAPAGPQQQAQHGQQIMGAAPLHMQRHASDTSMSPARQAVAGPVTDNNSLESLLQAVQAVQDSSEEGDHPSRPSSSAGMEPSPSNSHLGGRYQGLSGTGAMSAPPAVRVKSPFGSRSGSGVPSMPNGLRSPQRKVTPRSAPPTMHRHSCSPRLEDLLGIKFAPCSVPLFHQTPAAGSAGLAARPLPVQAQKGPGAMGYSAPGTSGSRNGSLGGTPQDPRRALMEPPQQLPTSGSCSATMLGAMEGIAALLNGAGLGAVNGMSHGGYGMGKQAQSKAGPGAASGAMGMVLNSQILAAMPASQMSTLSLFKAVKMG